MPVSELGQNVNRSVHIAIMNTTAITASPSSYFKPCDTLRPRVGNYSATRTGLRGESFVDFLKPCSLPNGFVREHVAKGRPARIIYGFRHAGLGESGSVHITHCDEIKLPRDARGKFVMEVPPRIADTGVDVSGLALLTSALRNSEFVGKFAKVPGILDLLPIGEGSEILQAQVDTNAVVQRTRLDFSNLDCDIQKPVTAGVLGKAGAIFDFSIRQRPGVEHAESVASEPEGIAMAFEITSPDRNPAERLLTTPAQIWLLAFLARFDVLKANAIDRSRWQSKVNRGPRRQFAEIEGAGPYLPPRQRMSLCAIAEIPNLRNRTRLLIQQPVKRFNSVAVGENHRAILSQGQSK